MVPAGSQTLMSFKPPTPLWKGCKRIGANLSESNSSGEPDALVFHPTEIAARVSAQPMEVKAGQRRMLPAPASIPTFQRLIS